MSKHTPGPWSVVKGDQIRSAIHQIARVWMMRNGEGKANAQLIAAAPEMAEALDAIRLALRMGLSPREILNADSPILHSINAALNKAGIES